MSHGVEREYDVYVERTRKAIKVHRCDACREIIRRGDRYTSIAIVDEGVPERIKRCARCQKIHEHLRDLGYGETWPDERLDCGEEYASHWGEEPPEAIQALAFATADEAQVPEKP